MKPHYRLHVNLDDRKPLWWVERTDVWPFKRTTWGFSNSRDAIRAAVRL